MKHWSKRRQRSVSAQVGQFGELLKLLRLTELEIGGERYFVAEFVQANYAVIRDSLIRLEKDIRENSRMDIGCPAVLPLPITRVGGDPFIFRLPKRAFHFETLQVGPKGMSISTTLENESGWGKRHKRKRFSLDALYHAINSAMNAPQ